VVVGWGWHGRPWSAKGWKVGVFVRGAAAAQGSAHGSTERTRRQFAESNLLQACAIYVLRAGIIEALTEAAQRRLLARLADLLLDKPGLSTPAAVVALEGMSILMGALGEVSG
jgi:hypothetical protein